MSAQTELSEGILRDYLARRNQERTPCVDRSEIVAHAWLSALAHHWPSRTSASLEELLDATSEIREVEHSRWMTQRRIAIARLAADFAP